MTGGRGEWLPEQFEINKVIVPVIHCARIVPNYIGYRIHVVRRGDTLSARAQANCGDASQYSRIIRANPLMITDPDLIFTGQELTVTIGARSR